MQSLGQTFSIQCWPRVLFFNDETMPFSEETYTKLFLACLPDDEEPSARNILSSASYGFSVDILNYLLNQGAWPHLVCGTSKEKQEKQGLWRFSFSLYSPATIKKNFSAANTGYFDIGYSLFSEWQFNIYHVESKDLRNFLELSLSIDGKAPIDPVAGRMPLNPFSQSLRIVPSSLLEYLEMPHGFNYHDFCDRIKRRRRETS